MLSLIAIAQDLTSDRSGVTALEYALVAALVVGVIVAGVTLFGTNLGITFSHIAIYVPR